MKEEFSAIAVTYLAVCTNNNRDRAIGCFSIDAIPPHVIGEDLAQFHDAG
jgi:hypothetical protein